MFYDVCYCSAGEGENRVGDCNDEVFSHGVQM